MSQPINTYDQLGLAQTLGLPPVAIISVWSQCRTPYFSAAGVWHLTQPADPANKGLSHRGIKEFPLFEAKGETRSERKKNIFEQAKAWASKKYGVGDWERNRMGDWVPAPLNSKFRLRK